MVQVNSEQDERLMMYRCTHCAHRVKEVSSQPAGHFVCSAAENILIPNHNPKTNPNP